MWYVVCWGVIWDHRRGKCFFVVEVKKVEAEVEVLVHLRGRESVGTTVMVLLVPCICLFFLNE